MWHLEYVFTLLDRLTEQFRFITLLWTTQSIDDTFDSHQHTRQIPTDSINRRRPLSESLAVEEEAEREHPIEGDRHHCPSRQGAFAALPAQCELS